MSSTLAVAPPAEPDEQAVVDPLAVIGRLMACPRGDTVASRSRLALLSRLLRHGGGWWRAEDLVLNEGETLDDLRAGLRELRRVGSLQWDERAQAFTLVEQLRVPLALLLLASSETEQTPDQLQRLDALIPFAMIGSRGDAGQAPVWAMLDVLERDLRAMQHAAADGPGALEQVAEERWLIRHAEDMQHTVQRLQEHTGAGVDRTLVSRAVELIGQTGDMLTRLSVRMSRTSRDQVRLAGSKFSARQLRAAAVKLDPAKLAAAVDSCVGAAPAPVLLPDELAVADAFPADLAAEPEPERSFPDVQQLTVIEDAVLEPDASELAAERIADIRPRRMARELFEGIDGWADAIRLQQGLVRVHAEAARLGQVAWRPVDEVVHLTDGSPIAAVGEIERHAA